MPRQNSRCTVALSRRLAVGLLALGLGAAVAGTARARLPDPAAAPTDQPQIHAADCQFGGGVWPQQDSPSGGTLPMPDFDRALHGPHGGLLADQPASEPAASAPRSPVPG
jgi:hypothetical protein